ncbi:early nodulin-like protein 17 [Magnolia sinica]|uniref:early nodulin-like protein 17 n=1 Tax=Magnolia sinica TaxID=86752 RepID=UPI002658E9E1|nr:early nodulin-like protein 17 [Magnolia sinica]
MLNSISTVLLILLFISTVHSTDHIVGGNRGWNPGINYTLWANNHTFYVGDLISFRYQKNMYNVYRVNETGYDNCTTDVSYGNWSSGKDFISLDHPKWYYFICGNWFCNSGMKVAVHVLPLPSPPKAAEDSAGKVKNGVEVVSRPGMAVLLAVAVSIWWNWM